MGAIFAVAAHRADVLVLRHGAGLLAARHRQRTCTWPARRASTPTRATVLGLMLSNGIVALASALYAQYQGFADINMGRGAIVIGLAAVIIGEVIFGKIFRNFALKLLAVVAGRGAVLRGHSGGAVAGPEHRRPEAAHRAGGGAVPGHPAPEGQTQFASQKGRTRSMLEVQNMHKTFNAGTDQREEGAVRRQPVAGGRRLRHRHRRQRRGQVHAAQRGRGRVADRSEAAS